MNKTEFDQKAANSAAKEAVGFAALTDEARVELNGFAWKARQVNRYIEGAKWQFTQLQDLLNEKDREIAELNEHKVNLQAAWQSLNHLLEAERAKHKETEQALVTQEEYSEFQYRNFLAEKAKREIMEKALNKIAKSSRWDDLIEAMVYTQESAIAKQAIADAEKVK